MRRRGALGPLTALACAGGLLAGCTPASPPAASPSTGTGCPALSSTVRPTVDDAATRDRISGVLDAFARRAWNPTAPAVRPSRQQGGLYINYGPAFDGASSADTETNINTDGRSDDQAGKSPRHDPLADLAVLRDLDAAAAAGIVVSNTPGVLDDCVADTAIGLMIDVARRFSASDRYVRSGQWPNGAYPLGARFSGRKLGIVGLGHIGHAIAKRAVAFDCEIRYMQRHPLADVPYAFEPDLVALARWADFLAIAVAGGESTRGLVSRKVLDALGPQGFVVNVARGSVIDEAALVEALRDGRLGGAGLDVYEREPQVPAELLGRDDVVLLPHVGSATAETRTAMAELTAANLVAFVRTGALLTPIPFDTMKRA